MKTMKKLGIVVILLTLTSLLAACQPATPTVDPAVKITEIAATIQAEFTQTAASLPTATFTETATATVAPTETPTATPEATGPTLTPMPTSRPTSTPSIADNAAWVADVTYPDLEYVHADVDIVKTWRIKNTGTTTWTTKYRLVYVDGLQGSDSTLMVYLTKDVPPETTVEISVPFRSPAGIGECTSYWRMYNGENEPFGEVMSMKIVIYK